ncbi:MAG: T9SS type B sorting domain-containing protein [Nonlabens sp.]
MRLLLFFAILISGLFVCGQSTNSAYLCLANRDIVLADFDTCTSTFIASTPESLFDISQGDTDDTLYGIKDESIYRINTTNGNVTLLGSLNLLGFTRTFRVTSLVKESNGILLGINRSSRGELFRIDVSSLTATLVGETGFESAGDLTFLNGNLYLSSPNSGLVLIDLVDLSQSSYVGRMNLGSQNIFGVVTVITANPCAANPTFDLIATGGTDAGVVNPNDATTTFLCSNIVSSDIFGAAEVNSDVICSIDLNILGDGQEDPSYCGTATPLLTTDADPLTPIGTYIYEWRELGISTVLSTNDEYSPTVSTTTTFECTIIDTGRAAPDNIATDRITVTIHPLPNYTPPGTIIAHSFYELPAITGTNVPANAAYYTLPDGNGTLYNIGDQVQENNFSSNPVILYVFGTDANGCDLTGQFTLEFATAQVVIDPRPASGIIEVCNGDQITITARPIPFNAYGNYTYNWDDGLGTSLPNTSTITVTPTQDTTFSVTINDSGIINGDGMGGDMIPVDVSFLDVDDVPDELAANGSFIFPPITGTDLTTPSPRYSLNPGGVGPFFDPGDIVTAADFTSLPARIYIYDNDGVCVDEEDFLLDFIQDLTVSITPSRAESCPGETLSFLAIADPVDPVGTYSYEWRVLGSTAVIGTLRELDYASNSTLDLECTVIDSGISGASGTAVATVEVEVTPQPSVGMLPDVTVINTFTFPTIPGTNLTGNERFYLQSGGVGSPFQAGDMVNRNNFTSLPVTIYVYDAVSGCSSQTDFELDILPVNLTLDLSASSLDVCEGTSVDFTATVNPTDPTDRYIFTWILDGTTIADTSPSVTITPVSPNSTIRCVVQDPGIAGAPDSAFQEIVINVTPAIAIDDPVDQIVTGSYTFPSPSGSNLTSSVSYNTDSTGTGTTFLVGDTVTAADFTTLPVEIFVIDSNGACDAVESFFLDFDDVVPSVSILSSGNQICEGDEVTLTAEISPLTPVGSYLVEWSEVGAGPVLGTDLLLTVSPTVDTDYQIVIIDTGLSSSSNRAQASVSITVDAVPEIAQQEDVVFQDQYTLPVIDGSNLSGSQAYYSEPNAAGTRYESGEIFTYDPDAVYPIRLYLYDSSTNGCFDEKSFLLTILEPIPELFYVPQVLTPNRDGYHDTWNVEILNEEVAIPYVYIYDRYGKLLKTIVPGGFGWVGTFNELPLPSSSYWYQFTYTYRGTATEQRGYFALKR